MKSKPVCFIAMAFNREDTDSLYDNLILPVLKKNGIKPVIINRRQSNQDINNQIIDQLEKCDFCISDLTYARQSVYYEAGFAERYVPVIYTVRKDHLNDGQPENLRVHFDLQMKPLITWDTPKDSNFTSQLERRLRGTVLRDWSRKQRGKSKQKDAVSKFNALSQSEKLSLLRRRSIYRLKTIGFRKWRQLNRDGRIYKYKQIMSGSVNNVHSGQNDTDIFRYVSIHAFPSATKSVLLNLKDIYSLWRLRSIINNEYLEKAEVIIMAHIILSLRQIPSTRIEDVFSFHKPVKSSQIYESISSYSPLRYAPKSQSIPLHSHWHFLSGITSEIQLREMLKEHIDNYIGELNGKQSLPNN